MKQVIGFLSSVGTLITTSGIRAGAMRQIRRDPNRADKDESRQHVTDPFELDGERRQSIPQLGGEATSSFLVGL